jgi:hypothetical protein
MLVPNPPGSICQRAPVVPHTRGKDETRGDHLVATSLFGRDPFVSPITSMDSNGMKLPAPYAIALFSVGDMYTGKILTTPCEEGSVSSVCVVQ